MSMRVLKKSEFKYGTLIMAYGDYLGERHKNYVIEYRPKDHKDFSLEDRKVWKFLSIPQWHFTPKTKDLVNDMYEDIKSTYNSWKDEGGE